MKLYSLEAEQRLPISLSAAWEFFSSPANLQRITPPWLAFEVTSRLPERMFPGMIVSYFVRPLLGIPIRWVTEITHVEEPFRFVDEQRFGPYRFWHHQHHFREIEGGVEMRDVVHYGLPPGGFLVEPLLVKPKLNEIFSFRKRTLEEIFGVL